MSHNFDTYIISDWELFERLRNYEKNTDKNYPIILDVESDSKEEVLANLYGIGLCFTSKKAFYIPWRNSEQKLYWEKEQEKEIKQWLHDVIKSRGVIGHNLVYDAIVIGHNLGFIIDDYIYADTILMKHTIDENPPFALKELAVKELGEWADKAQDELKKEVVERGGRWVKDQKDMYLASIETLGTYCCWDVILTKLLFDIYDKKLTEENLEKIFYEEEVMPLYRECTITMKRRGFPINVEHFRKLKEEIEKDIKKIEEEMYNLVKGKVIHFEKSLLRKTFPVKNSGNFPKVLAKILEAPLPINKKSNKITLAKKAIELQMKETPEFEWFYKWVIEGGENDKLTDDLIYKTQLELWKEKHGTDRVFNFRSNDHLIILFFNIKKLKPLGKTEKGKPQIDDKFIDTVAKKDKFAKKLQIYKKLNKIKSTYIEGILEREINGVIYTSMLQFGTTSGRFSSRNPNLQNLSRPIDPKDAEELGIPLLVIKYVNAIREGFIPPKGYVIVDADYSSLEPRCFAMMSGDEKLINVFKKGEDLYSRIAIDVFNLSDASANPNDENYLKKVKPEFRQLVKKFCLATVYGAEEARISQVMQISYSEASGIIRRYLNAYPNLRRYMRTCDYEAKKYGYVKTIFGRVRHLKEARALYALYSDSLLDAKWASKNKKLDLRRKLKNALNNAKNFKIQGLAAHIVNMAMIAISREFKKNNIDGYIALQVHDQIIAIVKEEDKFRAKDIIKRCMENTTKIEVPLIAEPAIAYNLKESH